MFVICICSLETITIKCKRNSYKTLKTLRKFQTTIQFLDGKFVITVLQAAEKCIYQPEAAIALHALLAGKKKEK